jgi:aspartate racemase
MADSGRVQIPYRSCSDQGNNVQANEKLRIGVLGGMGPAATIDFMAKVRSATPAIRDQDHIPLIVYCVPQIPDRSAAVLAHSDAPLPHLLDGVRVLQDAGVHAIAIACNTAHHWHAPMQASSRVPILHIADAVRRLIVQREQPGLRVALMGTPGTRESRLYDHMLSADCGDLLFPDAQAQDAIDRAIASVKAGQMALAREASAQAAGLLLGEQGADLLLLACTELPIAMQDSVYADRCIDATQALAQACVQFSMTGCKVEALTA